MKYLFNFAFIILAKRKIFALLLTNSRTINLSTAYCTIFYNCLINIKQDFSPTFCGENLLFYKHKFFSGFI